MRNPAPKCKVERLRDDSAGKSTDLSFRGLRFLQHPYGGSQQSITPASSDLTAPSDTDRHQACYGGTQTYMQANPHTHKILLRTKRERKKSKVKSS